MLTVELLDPRYAEDAISGMASVLVDCVEDGASVGFVAPLTHDHAVGWWRHALTHDSTLTWVAHENDRVAGVVRLTLASQSNGRHRAEVSKLLVRRDGRGRGVGRALMSRLEQHAADLGRTLLLLNTRTGSPAERLYEQWGWKPVGVIEDYAAAPSGELAPKVFMTKRVC